VEIPQVRAATEPFVSKLFPRGTKLLGTEPLRAMVIGAFVRGLSMRDVESAHMAAGPCAYRTSPQLNTNRSWPQVRSTSPKVS
jgi:hypothetical protein